MPDDQMLFVYQNAKGEVSERILARPSESEEYLQGYCVFSGAFRAFRKDRILEIVDDGDQLGARLKYFQENTPPPPVRKMRNIPRNSENKEEVCFTGFKSADKQHLADLSVEEDYWVSKSVTVGLTYLCCGPNAGPKKMEKARVKGVVIITEEQFLNLIKYGEVPEG